MDRENLSPKRRRKEISISETTVEMVGQYAQMHGLSFSRAIEGLALMSIRDARMLGTMALLRATIRAEITHQFNRYAKLSVHAGIEAGMAKEAILRVYWLLLLQEMDEYTVGLNPHQISLSDFESRFAVDPKSPSGQALITLLQKSRERFRARSAKALKKPIEGFIDLLDEMAVWAAAIEERSVTTEQPDPL